MNFFNHKEKINTILRIITDPRIIKAENFIKNRKIYLNSKGYAYKRA